MPISLSSPLISRCSQKCFHVFFNIIFVSEVLYNHQMNEFLDIIFSSAEACQSISTKVSRRYFFLVSAAGTRIFRRQDISPTDTSPKVCYGHFADRHFAATNKGVLNSIQSSLNTYVLTKQKTWYNFFKLSKNIKKHVNKKKHV